MSEERLERIESELGRLVAGQSELRTDVTGLRTEVTDLRRHMLVLHEDVIATIKTTSDSIPTCQRITDGKIADLREEIGQRLDPLEAVVRKHFGT
jgi:hypothetical protein